MGFRFTDSRFTADGFTGYCLSGYRFMGERFAWHRLTGNRFTGYQIIALRATQNGFLGNRTLRGGLQSRAFGAGYVLLLDRDAAVMQPTGWGPMFWPPSEMYFLSLDWELKVLGRALWDVFPFLGLGA